MTNLSQSLMRRHTIKSGVIWQPLILLAMIRAYLELLRAYQEGGHFGDNESNEFTARFNRNKEYFDKDSIVYIDMLYEAGNTYLYFI